MTIPNDLPIGHQLGSLEGDGLCQFECGKGSPEGQHYGHGNNPCSWHYGRCEDANMDESLWCQCGRDEVAHRLWRQAHPEGKPVVLKAAEERKR